MQPVLSALAGVALETCQVSIFCRSDPAEREKNAY